MRCVLNFRKRLWLTYHTLCGKELCTDWKAKNPTMTRSGENELSRSLRIYLLKGTRMRGARIFTTAAWLTFVAIKLPAAAHDWPRQPVQLVVNHSAGGCDGNIMASKWTQTLIIDNKSAVKEIPGATAVAKAEPDEYAHFLKIEGALQINPLLCAKLSFDSTTVFMPMTGHEQGPFGNVVQMDSSYENLQQPEATAKWQPG